MKNIFIEMKRLMLLIAGIIFIVPACTNLDEELYSDLAAENFFTTEEENIAALGQAYSSMTHWEAIQISGQLMNYHLTNWLYLQEEVTGMMVEFFYSCMNISSNQIMVYSIMLGIIHMGLSIL